MSELPLSDLCSICHIQPPKYRCPRCNTRTCSLPCTRRHKLWSQCSGIRDPAAYLRRNELATEAAFDRDFNFITGIERSIERAGRDAENRGINVGEKAGYAPGNGGNGNGKRKRGQGGGGGGVTKGEMGFMRRVESAGVKVVRAPKGMSRNRSNGSRWLAKNQCLIWTVEWIMGDGEKKMRNCTETSTIADSHDRVLPRPKEDNAEQTQTGEKPEQELEPSPDAAQDPASTTDNTPQPTNAPDIPDTQPETTDTLQPTPHRDVYFYLHRPRTTTKQPVLIPLSPKMSITAALRGHTVLEFPTIYALPDSPDTLQAQEDPKYLLEEDYLRTHQSPDDTSEDAAEEDTQLPPGAIDLGGVDEKKVLEVLQKDLFEPSAAA
ncbi:putative HIT finger domain protein [Aspergillus sclerotioniger CBS 115572]|uniref:Box C/D snoRNA protein 1 n=1 Tax=Aspergillus sclerotioniger CBS 115572 TaxID=1450535 RepID=A0A317X789_9EURO|nr:putative HIT finger domain protein [Aspergillus sclerotioniger CBS 115572]PWY94205.1 putative HIT finger domain protein [Aspergillus sclerotioniger CBS 115572]